MSPEIPLQPGSTASKTSASRTGPAPRLALRPEEAAASIGVSRDFFDDHIAPELRLVRVGRKVLVPIRQLEGWLERTAARTLADG